jgi:hypothetical protein
VQREQPDPTKEWSHARMKNSDESSTSKEAAERSSQESH